ncbi:MAG: phosphatidate cytidylyltransferase [Candidatus Babeliales bacterium]
MNEFLERTKTSLIIGICAAVLFLYFPPMVISALLIACAGWILLDEWPKIARHMGFTGWLLAIFYIILPFEALIYLNRTNQPALIMMCILVASCDIGSYIFGSLFGKHLLAPDISPKKTWEGLWGGIFTTIITFYGISLFMGSQESLTYSIFAGIPIALLAIAGDLFESFLKRNADIKDAGSLLPGHGGLLDRFDSLIFVVTFYYYFLL